MKDFLIYWMVATALILPIVGPIVTRLDPQWAMVGALYLIAAALWRLAWK